jgi:integral membrane sensor domain MASE1
VVLPELISWDAIDRVEVRGGSSLQGALVGAVTFGVLGALLGAAAVSLAESGVSAGEGAAIGALYVAPVGFALGGLGGMAARRWVVIYPRR